MNVWRVWCEDKKLTRSEPSGIFVANLRNEGRLVTFLFRGEQVRSRSCGSRLLQRGLECLDIGFRINPEIQLAESSGAFQQHGQESYDIRSFLQGNDARLVIRQGPDA